MQTEEYKRLERYFRRQRQKEDEKIIHEILMELKQQHEQEKLRKIEHLQQQLERMRK